MSTSVYGTDYYQDNFDGGEDYGNNNGTIDFTSDWYDSEDQDPATGQISIDTGINKLILDDIDETNTYNYYIERHMDLGSASSVKLYIKYDGSSSGGENISVEMIDAGDTWHEIGKLDNSEAAADLIVDPVPQEYLLSDAVIRFRSGSGDWDAGDIIKIQSIRMEMQLPDTDGDGVADIKDIDDDNDGILDVNESTLDKTDFELHGDARQVSENEVRLTVDSNNQFGTSMSIRTVDLNHNFTIDAEIYLGTKDGGADGISFVLHNDPDGSSAIGTGEGSTLGSMANSSVHGIRNGLSIEFDTYKSVSGSDDPAEDHTQIRDTDYNFNDTGGRVTGVTKLSNLEDGNWHTVHLVWNADSSRLSYTIDGTSMPGITDTNLAADYFDGSSHVYYGFTAATGGLNNVQSIRYVSSSTLKDSDGDGIYNSLDLDSDNDGIPDNVEAQKTNRYIAPSGQDTDGDGLDDAYDPDNNGTLLMLDDSDHDNIVDTVDTDSDNDGYSDCEEGLPDTTANKSCPVASVEGNGRVSWAGSSDYSDINGIVDTPSSDLFNETGDTSEVGYREFLCGKALTTLTKRNWKLISIPCDTGSISIQDLLGNSLGQYGEPSTGGQWVMYRQSALVANDAGNDNFEINTTSKPNTNKTKLDGDDIVVQGVGYWIIWDDGANNEVNVTINESIDGINPTQTTDADNDGIDDPDFTKVYERGVPNNDLENGWAEFKKFMAGNPFPYAFEVKNLYFAHDVGTGSYYPMGDANNDTYINATFYKYDSSDRSSKSVTDGGGYEAVNPGTPGFTEGGIKAMEGFFIKINGIAGETKSNGFAYPLITKNGSGN